MIDDKEFEKALDRAVHKICDDDSFEKEIREKHFSAGVSVCYCSGEEPKGFFTREYPDGRIEYVPL